MAQAERNADAPRSTRGNLRAFARYYRPHLRLFLLDMACALIVALVDLMFPVVTRTVLDTYLPAQMYGAFFGIIALMGAAYLLRCAMQWVITYLGHMMGVLMEADMRRDIFAQLQRLSFSYYDRNRTGRLMSRVTNDLFEITELAHHGPEDLFISAVTLIGAFAVLFSMQWRLALVLLVMVPALLCFAVSQRRRMSATSRQVKERMAGINADIESSISGVRVAKAFTNEGYEIEKFRQGNERFKGAKRGFYSAMAVFHSGMELLLNLMGLLVLLFGGLLIMGGGLTLPELVTFNLYIATIQSPIRRLAQFVEQFNTGMAGFHRFQEVMKETPDIQDAPDAVPLSDVKGDVQFEDVTFAYEEGRSVLSHVNLHIRAGEMLALVGPSGGGKTTLCQLLPRFYDVREGVIRLDGQDIRRIRLADLRGSIGIVQQDVFLFAGTVMENIRYGRPDATEDEVVRAAKLAEIHEDILQMPEGYQTMVGERGILLSGGQKQRVAIARIFLKNPPILILDEATSALDTATEVRIQRALGRLAQGRTTLVIAHRLSTIRGADEIVVIDEHGIEEQGTHEELMRRGGAYRALYEAQFGQDEPMRRDVEAKGGAPA